jgi:deoxycytidylate deaminase
LPSIARTVKAVMPERLQRMREEDRELFFGLVGPIGTGSKLVAGVLEQALEDVACSLHEIHVIDELRRVRRVSDSSAWARMTYADEEDRYIGLMAEGNRLCAELQRGDALVPLAIDRIQELRRASSDGGRQDTKRRAYLFRSLKRRDELDRLRAIYEGGFLLLGIHAPRSTRVRNLADTIARSKQDFEPSKYIDSASRLIEIDEEEAVEFGQDVRAIFKNADFFVGGRSRVEFESALRRFVELIFGHPFHTPTLDEHGMAHAALAALRSADLSRQVGAAIMTADGSIVAVGCNEVPRAGGGQYWSGGSEDFRDFQLGKDLSGEIRVTVLQDVVKRLAGLGLLAPEFQANVDRNVTEALSTAILQSNLGDARVMRAIEYGRIVHAEMAAIVDAARRGLPVEGCTLYSTTFPCHECTRHIVAAGIRRVVFIESYPKSLGPVLFFDSVETDPEDPSTSGRTEDRARRVRFEQYVGVSPRLYPLVFRMPQRRGTGNTIASWEKRSAVPRFLSDPRVYLNEESAMRDSLVDALRARGLRIDALAVS